MAGSIPAFCLDWHVTSSGAFNDLLVDPLASRAKIKLTAWDGQKLPAAAYQEKLVIFCMLPPSPKFLEDYRGRIIWLPMWDQAQGYDDQWWDDLPKNVHIVAFSKRIYQKATAAGLPVVRLQYYKDPAGFKPVSWQAGKVIFYWNRTGLVGPEFLGQLCTSLDASKLIFRGQVDPRIDKNVSYTLPAKLDNTVVENISTTSQATYFKKLDEANIFLAPRKSEGAGMTFIEAMAKGCGVLAYDAPTMDEYITNGRSGILLRNYYPNFRDKLLHKNLDDRPSGDQFHLSDDQPWQKIAANDFESLGKVARDDTATGFKKWQQSISNYAGFVLGK